MSDQLPETLQELFKKLEPLGAISTLISRTLQAVLLPQEKILLPFYQMEKSENYTPEGEAPKPPSLGTCEIKLITTHRFISMGFYPSYHRIDIKDVHAVSAFTMTNRFSTGYEGEGEVTTAEERGYNPKEIQIQVHFVDAHGENVAEWVPEASRPEDIKTLFKQLPTLSKLVGRPLAECQ